MGRLAVTDQRAKPSLDYGGNDRLDRERTPDAVRKMSVTAAIQHCPVNVTAGDEPNMSREPSGGKSPVNAAKGLGERRPAVSVVVGWVLTG